MQKSCLCFLGGSRILGCPFNSKNHALESFKSWSSHRTPLTVKRKLGQLRPARGADSESELDWQDPGGLLERYRQYLLMIANEVIGPELRAKLGASDLVQDTFLEAQRRLDGFRGRTGAELRAWLREILECRLANLRRSYLTTEKRRHVREVAIETLLSCIGPEMRRSLPPGRPRRATMPSDLNWPRP